MKSDIYKINNNVERIKNGRSTLFLDGKLLKLITAKLSKREYNIYYPYKEAEKVMLYTGKLPKISLYKIITVENLRHQDILGSIFALNVDSSYFGDIINYNNNFYFYVVEEIKNFIQSNLTMIGKIKVDLKEVSLDCLNDYERKYEELQMIVSSLRIDTIISNIIGSSRKIAIDKISNKEIIVNYEFINKCSYVLKENDVFSIRKYGKYKFIGIVKGTKKNNFLVRYLKYI